MIELHGSGLSVATADRDLLCGLNLDLYPGQCVALVGESGSGKTVLSRAAMGLLSGSNVQREGKIVFDGKELSAMTREQVRNEFGTGMAMIFQDPISSLDPRMTVQQLIDEPLEIWGRGTREERNERINTLLNNVGLEPELVLNRRSYEFSGGQCQRISIARALALDPRMLICDEPVSALDVSIQAQILNLLQDMKDQFGLTMVFISHDLAVVKAVSNRVMVMYLGKICEVAITVWSEGIAHIHICQWNIASVSDSHCKGHALALNYYLTIGSLLNIDRRSRSKIGATVICSYLEPFVICSDSSDIAVVASNCGSTSSALHYLTDYKCSLWTGH